MKERDKNNVNFILDQCIESFQSWNKKSSSVHDIQNQLYGLSRAKWEVFKIPETFREKLQEALEMRLIDELQLLSNEIKSLESLEKALEAHKLSLESYCSSQLSDIKNPGAVECLVILCSICTCLSLVIGIERVPLRRISLEDAESFKFLEEANEAMKQIKKDFEDYFDSWKERVSEIEF